MNRREAVLALGSAMALAACGGGGSDGTPVVSVTPPVVPPVAPPVVPPVVTPPVVVPPEVVAPVQGAIPFINASVHDPSVIKVADTYYVFGSHLAAAKSTDLMNWTKIADGVNAGNPLFNNVVTALADTFAWSQVTGLWAPDVIALDNGKFAMYYNSCKGDSPRSAMGLALADKVEGPYVNQRIFLKSGMWGQLSEDGVTMYDALTQPNVVDPNTFRDAAGKLWMIYGSYSGGIFILALDPATGLPAAGQGYGKHVIGGNHSRIEGAYVLYSPQTQYYYLFTSFGGLDANGAYNMRVARSRAPDGPYVDAKGNDMRQVKSNPALPLFDDASIAPFGQKLMGNHQFALAPGETGTPLGYVSPGHNSAMYDAATQQYFLIFHTRFPNTGELHEIRVHELFMNSDGWLVAAPFRYVPLSRSVTPLAVQVAASEVAGSYKLINHGKDISTVLKLSQNINLLMDGTITGAVTGTWTHQGNNLVAITLASGGLFNGVLSRQWNANAAAFAVTFTAQSADGVSIWGARTGT